MRTFHILFICIFLSALITSCKYQATSNARDELIDVGEKFEADCDECNGSGYVFYSCGSCGGTGQKFHYSSETRPKECYNCMGTGRVRCETCGGYGYTRCQYCNGHGSFQCTVCHGYGIIVLDPLNPHLSHTCNNCKGSGYEECLICRGSGKLECCDNGLARCPVCWGSGRYGQENITHSGYVTCDDCNGSGRYRSLCDECNGTGRVIKTRIVQKKKSEL